MRNRFHISVIGILAAMALIFTGCYPFQGDITLLLTPVPPPEQGRGIVTPAATPESAAAVAAAPVQLTATVAVRSLRVRQGPGTDTPIIAGLRGGDSVTVVGRNADSSWLQIQVPDVETVGWVAADLVTLEGAVADLSVTSGEEVATAEAGGGEAAAPQEAVVPGAKMPVVIPSVTVADQEVTDGTVTVAEVTAAQDGWIVIHADDGGTFGAVIGHAPVAAGTSSDVVVEIDTEAATETLYAMLHMDAGEAGVYEFPGPDGPVIFDGAPVSPAFNVTLAAAETGGGEAAAGAEAVVPSVTVGDQEVTDGAVTVAEVVSPGEGWIVIHADDAGAFGPVIGHAAVAPGTNTDVMVTIDTAAATETLYAMLHQDGGEPGVYEFPGPDGPVLHNGAPVSPAFTATISEAAAPGGGGEQAAAGGEPTGGAAPEPVSSAAPVSTQLATVTTRSLRVRSEPTAEAEIVAGAKEGEVYPVAEVSADGDWVSLYFPGFDKPVWVAASLVELSDTELVVKMGTATVTTDGARLRLRNAPSSDGDIVGYVLNGQRYPILGTSPDGEWALLIGTGTAGPTWGATQFLTVE